jgi:hypothetical protein
MSDPKIMPAKIDPEYWGGPHTGAQHASTLLTYSLLPQFLARDPRAPFLPSLFLKIAKP